MALYAIISGPRLSTFFIIAQGPPWLFYAIISSPRLSGVFSWLLWLAVILLDHHQRPRLSAPSLVLVAPRNFT